MTSTCTCIAGMKMATSSEAAVTGVIPFPPSRQRKGGMTARIIWTGPMDTAIKRMRAEAQSWEVIAAALGVSRWTAIERGRVIGARLPPPDAAPPLDNQDREPLPPGHRETWDRIIMGTCLEGTIYRRPELSLGPSRKRSQKEAGA